ncbi:MAG: substrate-binding domain-containing protein [Betaproteobacteria bacterium]|nr:substrate-binding domain-containing protein [Betaproteobacteria bacterium]
MTAEIKVFSTNSMHAVLDELVPAFERASGNRVSVSYETAIAMLKRIKNGETADLAIMGTSELDAVKGTSEFDELEKLGKIAADSRRVLSRFGVGIGVRAGAPKPDIGSVEAFKRMLLNAKSIAYTLNGASGIHFAGLIERLGIAEQVKAKAVTRPGGLIAELVTAGEAEIAVQQIPELMAVPGIEVVGPLPQELQVIMMSSAGIFSDAKQPGAARALLEFLSTPASARVFKAKGLEPAQG